MNQNISLIHQNAFKSMTDAIIAGDLRMEKYNIVSDIIAVYFQLTLFIMLPIFINRWLK